jgi:lysophospholipid acyltransferase (LPLAT)-like uncharacterized protein
MKQGIVTALLEGLIRLWAATWRFRIEGSPPEAPSVLAFWHGTMLPVWKYYSQRSCTVHRAALVSLSRDGSLLAALLSTWGYTVVRGSSSQGGKEALKELIELARMHLVFITPDGPRGPRHYFKVGAVITAQRADVPLAVCKARYKGICFERSWDKFLLPYPFACITLQFSEPIIIAPSASREEVSAVIAACEHYLTI